MRSYTLLFILFLFFSCKSEPKPEGSWYFNFNSEKAWEYERPNQFIIKNDSISFSYLYFNHWQTFPLKVENQKLKFNNFEIDYSFDKDTLVLNKFQKFTKKPFGLAKQILDDKSKVIIDLPKLSDSVFTRRKLEGFFSIMHLRKTHNTNKHVISYNDKTLSFDELNNLRYDFGHHQGRLNNHLFIDSSTKMKDVEYLLIHLIQNNNLKVSLINNISINFNSEYGIFSEYQTISRNLILHPMNKEYILNHEYSNNTDFPPLPPPYPKFKNDFGHEVVILKLIKNQIHYKNQIIKKTELYSIIDNSISKNSQIITLFDLESDYASFLEIIALVSSIYQQKRNELSIKIHNKNYDALEKTKQRKIRDSIPIRHFWNYSIPHFEKIIKEDGTFYGLEIE